MKNTLEIVWDGVDTTVQTSAIPVWKRCFDIAFIACVFPVAGPLGFLIACYIKLVSRGPVFFRQERVGRLGRRFVCFKFRSMKVGADTRTHKNYLKDLVHSGTPMTKMDAKGDSRLIPFGSFLRSTGLDELPQLINVLRGEMSFVGPRPCIPYEYEEYLPWQKERFNALPGLTGLWQVSGKNRTTFREMINLDIAYVRKQSVAMDLRIIARTLPALATQVWETQHIKRVHENSAPLGCEATK